MPPNHPLPKRRRTNPPTFTIHAKRPANPTILPPLALHPPGPPPTHVSLRPPTLAAYSASHLSLWRLHLTPPPNLPAHLAATYIPPPDCIIHTCALSPDGAVVALVITFEHSLPALLLLCSQTARRLVRVALPDTSSPLTVVWTVATDYCQRTQPETLLPPHLQKAFCTEAVNLPVSNVKDGPRAKFAVSIGAVDKLLHYHFAPGYRRVARVGSVAIPFSPKCIHAPVAVDGDDEVVAVESESALMLCRGTMVFKSVAKMPFKMIRVCALRGEKVFALVKRRFKGKMMLFWAVSRGKQWRYVQTDLEGDPEVFVWREEDAVVVVSKEGFGFRIADTVEKVDVGEVCKMVERVGDGVVVRRQGGVVGGSVAGGRVVVLFGTGLFGG